MMIGQTISHYKILEKLGEGGMGVVYKAHDDKLDRIVALKFLPKGVEAHEQERSRFLQEAKAVSLLNHPHICTIHSLGEHEGQEFIDMEYVDGVTLRKKIQDGGLKLPEIITYAIQIAEALEEAHTKGIVHRDVKPENIMVNSRNEIKVMDFGLAKLKGSVKLTKTSSTVGTLAYMSPEQIQGGPTDARSDIFSFGIVLYEMLSGGHVPFRGEHEAALLYSIVNEDPAPIQQYRHEVSPELLHILNRSLEKDTEERYQTVRDMLIDLRRLHKETTRVVRGTAPVQEAVASGTVPEEKAKQKRWFRRPNVIIPVSSVLLLGMASILYFMVVASRVRMNPDYALQVLQLPFKAIGYPALSPDGKWIVFRASDKNDRSDLWITDMMGREPRRLTFDSTATVGAEGASISPDGNFISFTRGVENEIFVVPFIGGKGRKIAEGLGPRWSPRGDRIGYTRWPTSYQPHSESGRGEFWTVKPDGMDNRLEFIDTVGVNTPGQGGMFFFAWSPVGDEVAWLRRIPSRYCEILIHDLRSGRERPVTKDSTYKTGVCWLQNGQLVYSAAVGSQRELWTVPASGGDPVQVTKTGSCLIPSSGDEKRLVCRKVVLAGQLWRQNIDGTDPRIIASGDVSYEYPQLSPDGKKAAVTCRMFESLSAVVYIIDLENGTRQQITAESRISFRPRWSDDGRWIAFDARGIYEPRDSFKVYVIDAGKLDVPKVISRGTNRSWRDTVSLVVSDINGIRRIAYLDGRPSEQIGKDSIRPSPVADGRYILYFDAHRDHNGFFLVPLSEWNGGASPKAKEILPRGLVLQDIARSGTFGVFLKDDKELWRMTFPEGTSDRLPIQFPGSLVGESYITLSNDEREILYSTADKSSKIAVFEDLFK